MLRALDWKRSIVNRKLHSNDSRLPILELQASKRRLDASRERLQASNQWLRTSGRHREAHNRPWEACNFEIAGLQLTTYSSISRVQNLLSVASAHQSPALSADPASRCLLRTSLARETPAGRSLTDVRAFRRPRTSSATCRSCFRSRPRYTTALPPRPSSRSMV